MDNPLSNEQLEWLMQREKGHLNRRYELIEFIMDIFAEVPEDRQKELWARFHALIEKQVEEMKGRND